MLDADIADAGLARCLLNHGEQHHTSHRQVNAIESRRRGMHELSIIQSVVSIATEAAEEAHASRVLSVTLRVGALAGVVRDALLFSYDVASAGTLLEGSKLLVEELPVVIHCSQCQQDRELPGIQSFRCPECNVHSSDIRQGRELEITRMELQQAETPEIAASSTSNGTGSPE